MQTLSCKIDEVAGAALDNEAAEKGLFRADYVLSVFTQGHEKTINLTFNDEKVMGRLEGKLKAQAALLIHLTQGRSKAPVRRT